MYKHIHALNLRIIQRLTRRAMSHNLDDTISAINDIYRPFALRRELESLGEIIKAFTNGADGKAESHDHHPAVTTGEVEVSGPNTNQQHRDIALQHAQAIMAQSRQDGTIPETSFLTQLCVHEDFAHGRISTGREFDFKITDLVSGKKPIASQPLVH